MAKAGASLPRRAPIDAYGNGGFRFAGMSHKGALLCLPSGIYGLETAAVDDLARLALDRIASEPGPPRFLLLGTGRTQVFPAPEVRRLFRDAKVGLEPMDTGAACRTYNVLLAEQRPVAAALIAVA